MFVLLNGVQPDHGACAGHGPPRPPGVACSRQVSLCAPPPPPSSPTAQSVCLAFSFPFLFFYRKNIRGRLLVTLKSAPTHFRT